MNKIRAIPTEYNGIQFRSKLEAEWAKFFDSIGIRYIYEPEGYVLSDGTKYLPDFYLPNSNQWFEVKGIMSDKDLHKILQLSEDSEMECVIGYANGEFEHIERWPPDDEDVLVATRFDKSESVLNKCSFCGGLSFLNSCGSYHCRCRGCYDGDHYCEWIMYGDGSYGSREKWNKLAKIDVVKK